jgi:hypothetical protein
VIGFLIWVVLYQSMLAARPKLAVMWSTNTFILSGERMASQAMAQVFPVDAATTTTITSVKAYVVAWDVVCIGVAPICHLVQFR